MWKKGTYLIFILTRPYHPRWFLCKKFITLFLLFGKNFKCVRHTILGTWEKLYWKQWNFWRERAFVIRQILINFASKTKTNCLIYVYLMIKKPIEETGSALVISRKSLGSTATDFSYLVGQLNVINHLFQWRRMTKLEECVSFCNFTLELKEDTWGQNKIHQLNSIEIVVKWFS